MDTNHEYKYLLADYWSPYKGLFLKDPRKIRAEEIYRSTIGEDACRPEDVAAHLQIPVEAVHEAIHYCTHNEEFLRREREKELAEWTEFEKKYPQPRPPATTPQS
jgi:hypothetical protein